MIDTLRELLAGLERLEQQEDLQVAVIGGLARGVWARPRATMDVDVIVDTTDLQTLVEAAPDAGLTTDPREVEVLRGSGMTRLRVPHHLQGPVRLDVLSADHPYYRRVIERAVRTDILGHELPVACAEDIIVLKVLADRLQDRADVAAIIASQGDRLRWDVVEGECRLLELVPPTRPSTGRRP